MPTADIFWEKYWAVVGFSRSFAEKLMNGIEAASGKEIEQRIRGRNQMITMFTDGTSLRWLKDSDNCRGFRIGVMWCDKSIRSDILGNVILPMYMGRKEDVIWVEEHVRYVDITL